MTPRALFNATLATADDIASQQVDELGSLPSAWQDIWVERHEYFDAAGLPMEGSHVYAPLADTFDEDVQKYRKEDEVGDFSEDEKAAILTMLV